MYYRLVLLLFCLLPICLHAQHEVDFEKVIEEVFAVQGEDVAYDEAYEYLFQLYAKPLNLNVATREDLSSIYLLSDRQINNFLVYREKYGPLFSMYELQFIPGFDKAGISRLLPFVVVEQKDSKQDLPFLQRVAQAEDHLWLFRYESQLEPKRGYLVADTLSDLTEGAYYLGAPQKLYSRMNIRSRHDFSFGFTAEKDAGEAFAWGPGAKQWGMDFWSFHAHLEEKGNLKDLVVGDYTLRFGQGLVLGSGFGMGKGTETVETARFRNSGIRPYTSSAENGFFRGLAGTYRMPVRQGNVEWTAFYSNSQEDGAVLADTVDSSPVFSALSASGLHRTPGELAAKNKIKAQSLGSHLQYNPASNNFHVGILYLQTDFDARWQKAPRLYNLYEFEGNQNFNLSGHVDYHVGQVSLFGEAARSRSGGMGAIAGMTAYISSRVQMAWLIRNYQKDFHSFFGHAFGESNRNINEKGMYWGLKMNPVSRTTLSVYYDYFRFPWMRYRMDAPSRGYEYLLRLDHEFNRRTRLSLQFRGESKEINTTDIFPAVLPGIKKNLVFNLRHELNEALRIRTRIQGSQYRLQGEVSQGSAIAQDITFNFGRLKADARFALFRTDDYQNRQYIYENDVLYAFSVPAYDGVGTRSYLVLRYKVNGYLQCWLKAVRSRYEDRDALGSGLETIAGNTRTHLKLQLLVKL